MRRALMPLVVLAAVVLGGCGGEPTRSSGGGESSGGWSTYRSAKLGLAVRYPSGWRRAAGSLTPTITDPREILTLATLRIDGVPPDNYCRPWDEPQLPEFSKRDALITIQEGGRGSLSLNYRSYPPRPERFRPERLAQGSTFTTCLVRDLPVTDHWFGFSDAGRAFFALVIVGRSAPERVRREAWKIVNSLRFDPEVKPDWSGGT
jgi:hypothetical protein